MSIFDAKVETGLTVLGMPSLAKMMSLTLAGAVVMVTGFVFTEDSSEMEALSSQFSMSENFTQIMDQKTPPRKICLGANPCPSFQGAWKADGELSNSELQAHIDRAGFEAEVSGNCQIRSEQNLEAFSPCGAQGKAGKFEVRVKVLVDEQSDTTQVNVFLF